MYDHIGLRVKSLDSQRAFLHRGAGAARLCAVFARRYFCAASGPRAQPALWLHLHKGPAKAAPMSRFRAPDHAAVAKFHSEGLKAGGRDNGGAGPRADYSPTYYAAFLIDPDGNNVEAVCT